MEENDLRDVDVLIIGAGLAGLTLARQLLLNRPEIRILMLDRLAELPSPKQKVGEATVQVSGYYYSRVIEMEEHLLREHYLKYNLRFYWRTERGGEVWEDLSQSYIRKISNIATYQLDRNKFEGAVLEKNRESPNFELIHPMTGLQVDLADDGPHRFRFEAGGQEISGTATWVVDASGRGRYLVRRQELDRPSPIKHGSSFLWVEGLLDPEKCTNLDRRAIRLRPERSALGHFPTFLATNHYCGEGYWFWEIPLHGKTSLGLVFDSANVAFKDVSSPEKLVEWVCREYPLFARDLPQRKILYHSGLTSFALDNGQTISPSRWAMCGEACRFTDPLYSPGGDLISTYNTLITDCILNAADQRDLETKIRFYEPLARAIYEAYVPSFAVSYQTLGDQESFSLRYVWELTVYFSFYVFPFINDLHTNQAFLPAFLRRFGQLGPINQGIHRLLVAYYFWKKENVVIPAPEPVFFEFTEVGALALAELTFYKVGVGLDEARQVLDEQLENLRDLARWTMAHVTAVVLDDPRALTNAAYIRGIDVNHLELDPDAMAERLEAACRETSETYAWRFEVPCMARFRTRRLEPEVPEVQRAVGAGSRG